MTRDLDDAFLALVAILVACAMTLSTCEGEAQAYPRQTVAEVLASLAVHEGGFDHPDEAAAILAVWRRVAQRRGVSLHTAARLCSPRFFRHATTRPWVHYLTAEARRPPGMGGSWETARRSSAGDALLSRRDSWLAILLAATAALEAPTRCVADSWGSTQDLARLRAAGRCYREVDCGNTADHFIVWCGGAS